MTQDTALEILKTGANVLLSGEQGALRTIRRPYIRAFVDHRAVEDGEDEDGVRFDAENNAVIAYAKLAISAE